MTQFHRGSVFLRVFRPSLRKTIVRGKAALLFFCLLLAGCSSVRSVTCDPQVISDDISTGPELGNARLDIDPAPDILPSKNYWLRSGERIAAKWDSYTINYRSVETPQCDFKAPPNDNCASCNHCLPAGQVVEECQRAILASDGQLGILHPQLAAYDGFMLDLEPQFTAFLDPFRACQGTPETFEPGHNLTYRLFAPSLASCVVPSLNLESASPVAEARIFVIPAGTSQKATFRLESHSESDHPGVVWFRFTMAGDGILNENFSPNLRIGKLRILKGFPMLDPATGSFSVQDPDFVVPSRVVLIQDWQEQAVFDVDRIRCYGDLTAPDGDFNLSSCRVSLGDVGGPMLDATPTYLKSDRRALLTWFIEFNPNDGGMAPSLQQGEVLAVEFTIQGI